MYIYVRICGCKRSASDGESTITGMVPSPDMGKNKAQGKESDNEEKRKGQHKKVNSMHHWSPQISLASA